MFPAERPGLGTSCIARQVWCFFGTVFLLSVVEWAMLHWWLGHDDASRAMDRWNIALGPMVHLKSWSNITIIIFTCAHFSYNSWLEIIFYKLSTQNCTVLISVSTLHPQYPTYGLVQNGYTKVCSFNKYVYPLSTPLIVLVIHLLRFVTKWVHKVAQFE